MADIVIFKNLVSLLRESRLPGRHASHELPNPPVLEPPLANARYYQPIRRIHPAAWNRNRIRQLYGNLAV
jgi:hypothetical protein